MVWPDLPRPSRGRTLSQFTPWKSRIKSVLEETKQRLIEEYDLGPGIVFVELLSSGTLEPMSSPLPTHPPLRC